MDNKNDGEVNIKPKGITTAGAITYAILISVIVTFFNLLMFLQSDMHEKVKLIQNPDQQTTDISDIDMSSPITADQLQLIKNDIDDKFDILKDEQDYSVYDISESTLGL